MVTEDTWASADAYDRFMGRWSRLVATEFLRWLKIPPGSDWIEIGCGTGALTSMILTTQEPHRIRGVDQSAEFIRTLRQRSTDPRTTFVEADARTLPESDDAYDVAVSALALNFIPDPGRALAEMKRVTTPGGTVAVYLWDYSEGMEMLRVFWDAAVALDGRAAGQDEGRRFGLCKPEALRKLFDEANLKETEVISIQVPTRFADFADYWDPFLGGQGPAAGYVAGLDNDQRLKLKTELEHRLPRGANGSIALSARAWAARGTS